MDLLNLSKTFKYAALFKVPEDILSQVQDYVNTFLYIKVATRLRKVYDQAQNRRDISHDLLNYKAQLENILLTSRDLEHSSESLSNLFVNIIIPQFDLAEDITGFKGKVYNVSAFDFQVKPNGNNYDLILAINHKDDNINISKTVNEETLIDILISNRREIFRLYKDIVNFYNNFNLLDKDYAKELLLTYNYAKSKVKSYNYNGSQAFKTIINDIPVIFNVAVASTDRQLQLNSLNNDNLGIFLPNQDLKVMNRKFLGTIAVKVEPKTIDAIENLKDLENQINSLNETSYHELTHLLQWSEKRTFDDIGMPSKKIRDKRYDQMGLPLTEITKEQEKQLEPIDPEKPDAPRYVIHPLRDVEFYPRLADEVSFFRNNLRHIPKILYLPYIKFYTDQITPEQFKTDALNILANRKDYPEQLAKDYLDKVEIILQRTNSEFFKSLKEFQDKKYIKAIKVFTSYFDVS